MMKQTSYWWCLALAVTCSLAFRANAQEPSTPNIDSLCDVDLSKPGQMADIISNTLTLVYKNDIVRVQVYLNSAKGKFKTGKELATAAAKKFGIDEKTFLATIEKYKHINCRHEGGGEANALNKKIAVNLEVSDFAEEVLVHVVLHELGHGLVREFDLPILGNEETLADTFATHYLVTRMPKERALKVLTARVASLMYEAEEVPRNEWTVKGEHNSDARRAYQIAAAAIAYDYDAYLSLALLVDMDEADIRRARDYGSEIHRSWRRILQPLSMPEGQLSSETRMVVEDDSMFSKAIDKRNLYAEFAAIIKSFDWHSQVTLRIASGDGGAGWSRSSRTITVHDEYIQRFNRQGKAIAEQKKAK